MQGRSWAATVGSKKPEPSGLKVKSPADVASQALSASAQNGVDGAVTTGPMPSSATNGAPTQSAPACSRVSTQESPVTTATFVATRKELSYEPAPNEIMRVMLNKPALDTKLGIRLAGEERPRVISLNADGVAAKSGLLQVGDVVLSVNGHKATGHEATTKILKGASGRISIELYRVQLPRDSDTAAAREGPDGTSRLSDVQSTCAPAIAVDTNREVVPVAEPTSEVPIRQESSSTRQNAWMQTPSRSVAVRPSPALNRHVERHPRPSGTLPSLRQRKHSHRLRLR